MDPKVRRYFIHFAQNFGLIAFAVLLVIYAAPRTEDFYCTYISPCDGLFGFGYEVLVWMMMLYCFFLTLFLTALGSSARYWWIAVSLSPILLLIVAGLITGADPTILTFLLYLGVIVIIGLGVGWFVRKALGKLAPILVSKIT